MKTTKKKLTPKTVAILYIIFVNKKVIILISVLKSKKISDSLGNIYINNWKKKREIKINTLYLISRDFKKVNKGLIRLRKSN